MSLTSVKYSGPRFGVMQFSTFRAQARRFCCNAFFFFIVKLKVKMLGLCDDTPPHLNQCGITARWCFAWNFFFFEILNGFNPFWLFEGFFFFWLGKTFGLHKCSGIFALYLAHAMRVSVRWYFIWTIFLIGRCVKSNKLVTVYRFSFCWFRGYLGIRTWK